MSLLRVASVGILAAEQQTAAASTTIAASIVTNGNGGSDTDSSTFVTASISFGAASRLALIAAVHQTTSGASADISSITGSSISGAVKIASIAYATDWMVHLWAATTTASAGAVTVNFGLTVAGCRFAVVECTNVNLGIGTSGCVQSKTHTATSSAQTVTLDNAFGDSHNATFAVYGGSGADTHTPKSGWTELKDTAFTPRNNADIEIQFINSNDGSSTATSTGTPTYGAICVELAAL
jgi:hypothetical protein